MISISWLAITPNTCGSYIQPFCSNLIAPPGGVHGLSGRPDFTQTNTFFNVPFSFTTTSCDFCGVVWARAQAGVASMLRFFITGLSPENDTLPVTVPALASSVAAGTAAAVLVASSFGFTLSDWSDLPH